VEDYALALAVQKDFFKKEAFEVIYERWWLPLSYYFAKQLGVRGRWNATDRRNVDANVEELISRVATKLWQNGFKNYDGYYPLGHYVWSSAFHEYISYQRYTSRRSATTSDAIEQTVAARHFDFADDVSADSVLASAREEMTDRERMVWDLHWAHLTNDEIAKRLKLTKIAVEQQFFRASRKVRRAIERTVGPQPEAPEIADFQQEPADELLVTVFCPIFAGGNVGLLIEPESSGQPTPKTVKHYGQPLEFRIKTHAGEALSLTPIASLNGSPETLARKIRNRDLVGLLVGQTYQYPSDEAAGL
jgi:RNA polymerase sigma factor (sigma-70 family)